MRRRGRRESPPGDLGRGDPCDKRSGPHDVPIPRARAGGSNLIQEVNASGSISSPHDACTSLSNWPESNIQGGAVAAPPPLRTAPASFDACSSSIEQRPCEIRSGPAPPADDTPYGTRLPHWPWGQPGRYCDRAGYRVTSVAGCTSEGRCDPPTDLLCPLRRLADGSRPSTPEGSRPAFARGDVATPIRPVTGRPSLPPSSFTRRPVGSPCGGPYPCGRTTGLPRCIAGLVG